MKSVNLSFETAQKMYESGDESLKAFALENYPELEKKPLPTKWDDENCGVIFRTVPQWHAIEAMQKLSQLMYMYNEDWEPNWKDGQETKYCLYFFAEQLSVNMIFQGRRFLTFKTKALAEEFLNNFRDLIMEAKPLL